MNTFGERLKHLRGAQSQAAFAKMFGIPQMTLSNYETGKSEPKFGLIAIICTQFSVSSDWLLFGRGSMHHGEASLIAPESTSAHQRITAPSSEVQENSCAACIELKRELELERHERRELAVEIRQLTAEIRQSTEGVRQTTAKNHELTAENRELTAENRHLWKENGDLREKCARLEAHQYQHSLNHNGGEAVG